MPKRDRKFCKTCDPYQVELATQFDRAQASLLDRAAQFSDYTQSEAWRLIAKVPERMQELEGTFRPLLSSYETRSIHHFSVREKFGKALIASGAYRESESVSKNVYANPTLYCVRVASGSGFVFRVATLTAGLDSDYDASLSRRNDAMQAMSRSVNGLLRSYRAQDLR